MLWGVMKTDLTAYYVLQEGSGHPAHPAGAGGATSHPSRCTGMGAPEVFPVLMEVNDGKRFYRQALSMKPKSKYSLQRTMVVYFLLIGFAALLVGVEFIAETQGDDMRQAFHVRVAGPGRHVLGSVTHPCSP